MAEEYERNCKQLSQITVIDAELFELSGKIASMLEQGRAESLKEAINLAIDEDRQEKHNQAMQEEAELQTLAAEEQARAAEEQADEAKYNASRRCQFCANFTKCSGYAKQNAANCAAYRPQ